MGEISDDKLREIIAGTKGVTPGPWTYGAQWLCAKVGSGAETRDYLYLAQVPLNDYDSPRWNADMAHVARLDPQTVTAICEELLARRSHQEGYRLVPVEPTGEMWLASRKVFETEAEKYRVANSTAMAMAIADRAPEKIYAAMIEASPKEGK